MIRHTQKIRWQQPINCFSVFDNLWGWRLIVNEFLKFLNFIQLLHCRGFTQFNTEKTTISFVRFTQTKVEK